MQKYRMLSVIGSGAYSEVFKAIQLSTGNVVAIKQMQLSKSNMAINRIMIREAKILHEIGTHPNIVKLIECFRHKQTICLVLEYLSMDLITFYKTIRQKQKRSLADNQIRHIFKQVCSAVAHMHSKNLMHRDIKPQNIMIDPSTLRVKLIDFGFAKNCTSYKNTDYMITRWYRPLEVVLGLPYSLKVDVFSLGALLLELYNQKEVFRSASNLDQLYWIVNVCGGPRWVQATDKMKQLGLKIESSKGNLSKLTRGLAEDVQDIVRQMLEVAPHDRINIFDVLQHHYFWETPKKIDISSPNASTLKTDPQSPHKLLLNHRQSKDSNNRTNLTNTFSAINTNCQKMQPYENNLMHHSSKQEDINRIEPLCNNQNPEETNKVEKQFHREYRNFHQSNEGRKKIISGEKLTKRTESYSQGLTITTARLKNKNKYYLSKTNNTTGNNLDESSSNPKPKQPAFDRTNSQDARRSFKYSEYLSKYLLSSKKNSDKQIGHSSSGSKINLSSSSINRDKNYHTTVSNNQMTQEREYKYPSTIRLLGRLKKDSSSSLVSSEASKSIGNVGEDLNKDRKTTKDQEKVKGQTMFAKVKKIVTYNYQQRDNAQRIIRKVRNIGGQSSNYEPRLNLRQSPIQ